MRAFLILVSLSFALAELLEIPEVDKPVPSQVKRFTKYVEFDGPTGTASIALASATANAGIAN